MFYHPSVTISNIYDILELFDGAVHCGPIQEQHPCLGQQQGGMVGAVGTPQGTSTIWNITCTRSNQARVVFRLSGDWNSAPGTAGRMKETATGSRHTREIQL